MPRGIPRPRSNYDIKDDEVLSVRPDLVIQGVGSLVVGIIATIAISAIFEDCIIYGVIVWVLVGTPCCLISGISSMSVMLGTFDPMVTFGKSLRCDVTSRDISSMKELDV